MADAVNLELLIDRVKVEEQHHADQPTHGQAHMQTVKLASGVLPKHREAEGHDAECEQERDQNGGRPQHPFPPLDAVHANSNVALQRQFHSEPFSVSMGTISASSRGVNA